MRNLEVQREFVKLGRSLESQSEVSPYIFQWGLLGVPPVVFS
jgi:hypothetical protein